MITSLEAYRSIRHSLLNPVLCFFETNNLYVFYKNGNGFDCVKKSTGEKDYLWMHDYIDLIEGKKIKAVFQKEAFEEYKTDYEKNPTEHRLAELYANVWNELCWFEKNGEDFCLDDEALHESLAHEYKELEQYFYDLIGEIMEQEEISYPPSVKDPTDHFYRLKPFMVRNGYTDSMQSKIWEMV